VTSIFVRHAIRHGTYDLYSLGTDPSPDFPRPQQASSSDKEQQLIEKVKSLQRKVKNLESAIPEAVEGDAGFSKNIDPPRGAPSAPAPEQVGATEDSRRLLKRQRSVLASIQRAGTPVQAATTPQCAAPSRIRRQPRQARGGRPRAGRTAQRPVQQHLQVQQDPQDPGYSQAQQYPPNPAGVYTQFDSYTPSSWSTSQYGPESWNGGYRAHVPPYMQQTQDLWNGFPAASTYDVPHPNSFAEQAEESYGHWYLQENANISQGYDVSAVSQVQAPRVQPPNSQPNPSAAAATYRLRADAEEYHPKFTLRDDDESH
jgi:hypothetical protein